MPKDVRRSFVDRCIRDTDGRLSLFQAPNLPISIWFVMLLLTHLTSGKLQSLASLLGFGALFTWAWLEIFEGSNYFRRLLGVIVLVAAVMNRL